MSFIELLERYKRGGKLFMSPEAERIERESLVCVLCCCFKLVPC
jgi:hypothetical protein